MSNLRNHAESELNRSGVETEIKDSILKMIDAFNEVGHSGGSAFYTIDLVHRLLNWENLTPITQDPEDWMAPVEGLWQNRRNPKVFSTDGGQTWYHLEDVEAQRPWIDQVKARWGDPKFEPPEEGTQLASRWRRAWVWVPEESPVNHGLHIDHIPDSHWELEVWKHSETERPGQQLTFIQPDAPTNDQIMVAIKQIWGW